MPPSALFPKIGQPNWENRTLWTGDNLDIMRGMNSESVDLIYADPPFKSDRNYSAPIGSEAAGAAFKDTWTLSDVDEAWHGEVADQNPALYAIVHAAGISHGRSMKSYLIMMAVRLMEMRRLLKSSGTIYLHCNQYAGHYLKLLMDSVFGQKNFVNEVVWNYGTPSGGRVGGKKPVKVHDCLLVYAKSYGSHVYVPQFTPYSEKYVTDWFRHTDDDGRAYRTRSRGGKVNRQYLDESKGMPLSTVWSDIMQLSSRRGWFPNVIKEELGYPTQKPLALLRRIIKSGSNEGDMILDPFAGCATACVAAEDLHREWIGIDLSSKAADLVKLRLRNEVMWTGDIHHRWQAPMRTDMGSLPNYRTNKHVLYGKQEGICGGCEVLFPFRNMTVDHRVPRAKGGTDHLENLWLLCGACNSMKGTMPVEAFIAKLKREGLRA